MEGTGQVACLGNTRGGLWISQILPTLLEKYGCTGQVKFVIHEFPLASLHPTTPRGAAAARCVAEQGATRFWQMHEGLFQAQREWNRLPDQCGICVEVHPTTGLLVLLSGPKGRADSSDADGASGVCRLTYHVQR
jgi:hypothetical protein